MKQPINRKFWIGSTALLLVLVSIVAVTLNRSQDASVPEVDPFASAEVEPLLPSPSLAVHASLWWNEEVALRDMALVQDMGFGWIKQKFPWRDIEALERGSYDWWRTDRIVEDAEEMGLNLLVRLDRQPFWSQKNGGWPPLENAPPADLNDFGQFCYEVAHRYQGQIQAYQVWNEPNLAREWGEEPPSPEAYVELLRICYEGIKRGDPEAIVISAGLAPTGTGLPVALPDEVFLQGIYDAGGAQYFDMLGVNAPGYLAPPQLDPAIAESNLAYGGHRWNAFRHVEDIRKIMVANGDSVKQVAILEMGWTTDQVNPDYAWFAVSEEEQAQYLVGAYWYAREHWTPWIGLMTTIFIPDPSWGPENEEYWWGIVFPGWPEPEYRPAYDALKNLPEW